MDAVWGGMSILQERLTAHPEAVRCFTAVKYGGLPLLTIPVWMAHQVPGNRCSYANHPDRGDHYHQYLEYVGHLSPFGILE